MTRSGQVGRGECRGQCQGGNPCALSDKAHGLHVCADTGCACHAAERYGMVRAERFNLPVYVPLRALRTMPIPD